MSVFLFSFTLVLECSQKGGTFFFISHFPHTQGRTLEPFEVLVKCVTYFDNIGAFYNIPCNVYIAVILNLASCSGDGDRDKVRNVGRKAVWLCSSRWDMPHLFFLQPTMSHAFQPWPLTALHLLLLFPFLLLSGW